MRYIGAIMIISSVSGMGFYRAFKIRKGYEELCYFKKILVMLRGQLAYSVAGISEVFWELSAHIKDPYATIFQDFSHMLEQETGNSFQVMWDRQVAEPISAVITKKEDVEKIRELGSHLGYLDKEMQEKYLNLSIEHLEESIRERRDNINSEEKFCKVIGLLAGLFLVIFLW